MKIRNLALAALLAAAAPVFALSDHTWVAGYGNDANTGTPLSPFATFQAAVDATAPGGVVSVLSPGDFGAVTLSHAISLDGGSIGGSITFNGTFGIDVAAGGSDVVTIRNLHVNGLGAGSYGILMQSVGTLLVENCVFENFTDMGIAVYTPAVEKVVVRNTSIYGGQLGFRVFQTPTAGVRLHASLDNVTIANASSAAIFIRNGDTAIANSFISNSAIGIEGDTSTLVDVQGTVLSLNTVAAQFYTTATVRFSNCQMLQNGKGFVNDGGAIVSDGNNRLAGDGTSATPTAKMPSQ